MRSPIRIFILLIGILAGGAIAHAREPLVVYRICCGMGSTIEDGNTPVFALYSDGLVIFQTAPDRFLSAQLDEAERQALFDDIATEELLILGDHYETPMVFDAATYILDVWYNGRRKSVSVYYMPDAERRPGHVPAAFLHAHDMIGNFAPAAAPYTPEWIDLRVWPLNERLASVVSGDQPPIQWPDVWPPLTTAEGPDSPRGRRLLLPGADRVELERFLNSRRAGQFVASSGSLWLIEVSPRVVFPRDELWRR
jgi:hypothetical protein